jgi:hypothetical protein
VVARSNIGRNTSEVPSSALQFNPRLGFNWDVYGDRSTQLRGGLGLFSGRTPFVWISNAYGNTGIDYVRFTCSGAAVPNSRFTVNPNNQPEACAGTGTQPSPPTRSTRWTRTTGSPRSSGPRWRWTGSWASWASVGTLEGLYTQDPAGHQVPEPAGSARTRARAAGGRAQYTRTFLQAGPGEVPVGEVIDISNTGGVRLQPHGPAAAPGPGGVGGERFVHLSDAFDVNRGGSSQAVSNWRFNPNAGDPTTFRRPGPIS